MMQQMTNKELEYVIDSMSNEDMLLRQSTAVVSSATHPELKSACQSMIQQHLSNYQTLLKSIEQHQTLAPQNPS